MVATDELHPRDRMWDFQRAGAEFLATGRRRMVADKMGLGKTWQGLRAWELTQPKTILIVCSKSALSVWMRWINIWFGLEPLYIRGNKQQRERLWKQNTNIVLCTGGVVLRDAEQIVRRGQWDLIIGDEVHKFLRNRQNQSFKAFKRFKSKQLYLLTGTAAKKGLWEIWGYLNLMDPIAWPSYWRFVDEYFVTENSMYGFTIVGLKSAQRLLDDVRPYILSRKKEQVRPEMPPKIRDKIFVEMSKHQEKIYNDLQNELFAEIKEKQQEKYIIIPSKLVASTKLRQWLVSPRLFSADEERGAVLDDLMDRFEDTNEKAVIYSPFVNALNVYQDELQKLKGVEFIGVLKGGMEPEVVQSQIDMFGEAEMGFILCSILFAASFDLSAASQCYFAGMEWTPDDNEQAEDRLHRGLITDPVNAWYYCHKGTVEEDIIYMLNERHGNIDEVFSRLGGVY